MPFDASSSFSFLFLGGEIEEKNARLGVYLAEYGGQIAANPISIRVNHHSSSRADSTMLARLQIKLSRLRDPRLDYISIRDRCRIDTYPSIISCVQIPSLPSSRSEFAPFKNSSGPFINRFIRTRCEENEHFFKAVQNEVISFVIKSIRVFDHRIRF